MHQLVSEWWTYMLIRGPSHADESPVKPGQTHHRDEHQHTHKHQEEPTHARQGDTTPGTQQDFKIPLYTQWFP